MDVVILITLVFGVMFILDKIDDRADVIELLLDGIIDRLNKLENYAKDQEKQTRAGISHPKSPRRFSTNEGLVGRGDAR
jgi:hypothetical protein